MLLSPIHGGIAVDSSWDNSLILRQCWLAARCLKDGHTAAVGYGLGTAAENILDITTVFIFAAPLPILASPMHPVLHSSCSTPVPYVSGLTALEIDTSVRAGFPSPAEDFQAERIDVLKHIILHPQATYTLRVRGDSMRDEGIFDDDVILVDRAIKPRRGHIVVAVVDGAGNVVRDQRGAAVFLRANSRNRLDDGRSPDTEMRRAGTGAAANAGEAQRMSLAECNAHLAAQIERFVARMPEPLTAREVLRREVQAAVGRAVRDPGRDPETTNQGIRNENEKGRSR